MDLEHLSSAVALKERQEAAETRLTTTGFRLAELSNKTCRNEPARLRAIERCREDLVDTFGEILTIKRRLKEVGA